MHASEGAPNLSDKVCMQDNWLTSTIESFKSAVAACLPDDPAHRPYRVLMLEKIMAREVMERNGSQQVCSLCDSHALKDARWPSVQTS